MIEYLRDSGGDAHAGVSPPRSSEPGARSGESPRREKVPKLSIPCVRERVLTQPSDILKWTVNPMISVGAPRRQLRASDAADYYTVSDGDRNRPIPIHKRSRGRKNVRHTYCPHIHLARHGRAASIADCRQSLGDPRDKTSAEKHERAELENLYLCVFALGEKISIRLFLR